MTILVLTLTYLLLSVPGTAQDRYVSVDPATPATHQALQCWNSLGTDNQGRVFFGFTSKRLKDGLEDFVLYRFDSHDNSLSSIGSFMQASDDQDNLLRGEAIPKGHTRWVFHDGKFYLGSQSFHDFKWGLEDLKFQRGAHLYEVDAATGALFDLSAEMENGVVLANQGLIALTWWPARNLLVGLTHPHSDLVFFDPATKALVKKVTGIPWTRGNPLSREVVAVGDTILLYRGTEDPAERQRSFPIYSYRWDQERAQATASLQHEGFWNGQTVSRDGKTIYVSTVQGLISRIDRDGSVTLLGNLMDGVPGDRQITYVYGITLSDDEGSLWAVPSFIDGVQTGELFQFDLTTKKSRIVKTLKPGVYTGSDLRDGKGHITMARFGSAGDAWSGDPQLVIIDTKTLVFAVKEPSMTKPSFTLDSKIELLGRWTPTAKGMLSQWTAPAIRVRFTGTALSMEVFQACKVAVSLDGGEFFNRAGAQTINLTPKGLKPGEHTATITTWNEKDQIPLVSFGLSSGGEFLAPHPAKAMIEFIGDSITTNAGDKKDFSDFNTLQAYPHQIGLLTGWDIVRVSQSGVALSDGSGYLATKTGMVSQYGKEMNFYHPEGSAWAPSYHPQVICINLGTNDNRSNPQDYRTSMTQLVSQIRTLHPLAKILVLNPFNGTFASEFPRLMADLTGVTWINTAGWIDSSDTSDGTHPNKAGSLKVAQHLIPEIEHAISLSNP